MSLIESIGNKKVNLDFNNPEHDIVNEYATETLIENIDIPNSILPFRKAGKFRCLPHEDEGIVNGRFVKGDTTAENEKRYVLQMQNGKIDYKSDGLKQVNYEFLGEEILTPWAKMINIKL